MSEVRTTLFMSRHKDLLYVKIRQCIRSFFDFRYGMVKLPIPTYILSTTHLQIIERLPIVPILVPQVATVVRHSLCQDTCHFISDWLFMSRSNVSAIFFIRVPAGPGRMVSWCDMIFEYFTNQLIFAGNHVAACSSSFLWNHRTIFLHRACPCQL